MKADWLLRAEAEQEQLWSQLCRLEAALSNENFMGQPLHPVDRVMDVSRQPDVKPRSKRGQRGRRWR